MKDLREILKYYNMKLVAEVSGVSHSILKNYSSYRKEHLTQEQYNKIVNGFDIINQLHK